MVAPTTEAKPDTPKPWLRRPGEPPRAYAAFKAYVELGEKRSLDAVTAQLSGRSNERAPSGPQAGPARERRPQASGRVKAWCREWSWVDRAAAFDAHMTAIRLEAAEKLERERAERLVRIRDEQVDKDVKHGQRLQEVGLYMVGFPVAKETIASGGKVTVIEPAPPRNHDVGARLILLGGELVREACDRGLALEAQRKRSAPGAKEIDPEQLRRLAAGVRATLGAFYAERMKAPADFDWQSPPDDEADEVAERAWSRTPTVPLDGI
jgi:hypothetical protein